MDTGVLGTAALNQFEFQTEPGLENVGAIPLPDELPPPPDALQFRMTGPRSTAVESLLAQNEDLMARLKVSLRRLNLVEIENQKLTASVEETRQRAAYAEDHTLVLKAKDQAWQGKLTETEHRTRMLDAQVEELNALLRASQTEVARYRKYHDRIRTQVKPQIVELKGYAQGLEDKVAGLQAELEKREGKIRDLREQIVDVTKNSRAQVEQAELRVHEMIESYEITLGHQGAELDIARETLKDLSAKAQRLSRAEQRADELENEVVELRRNKAELSARFETESRRLLERIETLASDQVRLRLENDDLRTKAMSDYDRLQELQAKTMDQQSQMENLRFVYGTRTEENERLKLSLAALERLNVDLCSRIQELKGSSPAAAESSSAT